MKKIADKNVHVNERLGMGGQDAWRIEYKSCVGDPRPQNCLNPYKGKDRPSTHVKVNECDH